MSKITKLKSNNWKVVFDNESNDFLVHTNNGNSISYAQSLDDAILKLEDYLKWTVAPQSPSEASRLKWNKSLVSSNSWRIVKQNDFYYVQTKDNKITGWAGDSINMVGAYDSLESAVLRVIETIKQNLR